MISPSNIAMNNGALHKFNRELHSTHFKRASDAFSGVALVTFLVWAIASEPGVIIASLWDSYPNSIVD